MENLPPYILFIPKRRVRLKASSSSPRPQTVPKLNKTSHEQRRAGWLPPFQSVELSARSLLGRLSFCGGTRRIKMAALLSSKNTRNKSSIKRNINVEYDIKTNLNNEAKIMLSKE
jgi:hypothetical protein